MTLMTEIIENVAIERWARHFARAPHQLNERHASDSGEDRRRRNKPSDALLTSASISQPNRPQPR
jgi:hypothetical protein